MLLLPAALLALVAPSEPSYPTVSPARLGAEADAREPLATDDALDRMKKALRDARGAEDPAEMLRDMRRVCAWTKHERDEVEKYVGRFLRKDEQASLRSAAYCALLADVALDGLVDEEQLRGLLAPQTPALRETAVWMIGLLAWKPADRGELLRAALDDDDRMVRQTAAWALGRFSPDRSFDGRVTWLAGAPARPLPDADGADAEAKLEHEAEDLVISTGGEILGLQSTPHEAWPRALDWKGVPFDSPPPTPRRPDDAGLAAAVPRLVEMVSAEEGEEAYTAALALTRAAPTTEEFVPELTATLGSDRPEVDEMVLRALSRLGPAASEAAPTILGLLEDPEIHPEVRSRAVVCLMLIGSDRIEEFLLQELGASEGVIMAFWTHCLGQLDELQPETLDALDASFLEGNYLAARLIVRSGQRGVPVFAQGLEHDLADVRGVSALALAELAPLALRAVPALREARGDENEHVAAAANEALKRIRG